jgi:Asp/Glu/hydantoin racemase
MLTAGRKGMSGMEDLVKAGVGEAGFPPVKVIDGAKAGVELLAGLARLRY